MPIISRSKANYWTSTPIVSQSKPFYWTSMPIISQSRTYYWTSMPISSQSEAYHWSSPQCPLGVWTYTLGEFHLYFGCLNLYFWVSERILWVYRSGGDRRGGGGGWGGIRSSQKNNRRKSGAMTTTAPFDWKDLKCACSRSNWLKAFDLRIRVGLRIEICIADIF